MDFGAGMRAGYPSPAPLARPRPWIRKRTNMVLSAKRGLMPSGGCGTMYLIPAVFCAQRWNPCEMPPHPVTYRDVNRADLCAQVVSAQKCDKMSRGGVHLRGLNRRYAPLNRRFAALKSRSADGSSVLNPCAKSAKSAKVVSRRGAEPQRPSGWLRGPRELRVRPIPADRSAVWLCALCVSAMRHPSHRVSERGRRVRIMGKPGVSAKPGDRGHRFAHWRVVGRNGDGLIFYFSASDPITPRSYLIGLCVPAASVFSSCAIRRCRLSAHEFPSGLPCAVRRCRRHCRCRRRAASRRRGNGHWPMGIGCLVNGKISLSPLT